LAERKFSVINRLIEFFANLSKENIFSRPTVTHWLGWLISLIMLALVFSTTAIKLWQIFLLIHLFFFLSLIDITYKKIRPPIEVLLLFLYLLLLIIYWIQKLSIKSIADMQNPAATFLAIQIFLIGVMGITFAHILVHNNRGKKIILLLFGFIGWIGYYALASGNEYFVFFFHALLIITLLQKTRWLEELTKVECWIYIVLIYLFYRTVSNLNPFHDFGTKAIASANSWYILTKVFYLGFKYYLLAMLVKTPVVLIYNHASLSRKLKISGLFQSTFPQFIQLILLLLIFYSFLSGWQAENLRRSIQKRLTEIEEGTISPSIESYKFAAGKDSNIIEAFQDYSPTMSFKRLSGTGIVELKRQAEPDSSSLDYFLFAETDTNVYYLVKVDTFLLKVIAHDLRYLAGTKIIVYPLNPGKWTSYIYQADFLWQGKGDIKIFPLGALLHEITSPISIDLEQAQANSKKIFSKINIDLFGKRQFVFGRVYLPLWKGDTPSTSYLAFDIILKLEPQIFWSGLPQIILVLIVVYLLLNSFVVRQVVRFGSQINETIVQKFTQLKRGIQQISTGNLDYKIKLEGEDEFVELADRFNQMGDQLKQTIEESREKDRFEYELKIAREVQLSLLPRHLPDIPGFRIAASMKTANEVGGDFYDIFPLDKNRFLFTIGDVSGKGSSAALYMAQCMSLVRFSRQFTNDPKEISSRLNHYFATTITDRQIFVTAIVGILDVSSNTLQIVRAGHTEPIFIPGDRKKEIQVVETRGIGIGLTRSSHIFEKYLTSFKVSLEPGDTIVCYTDGVVEAVRQLPEKEETEMQMYGEDRLQNLLNSFRGKTAEQMLKEIELDIDSFYAGNPKVDDHTVLIIQRKTP
jgi:serine phosphatase RsbU (regulator of sigma subunit)